MSCGMTYTEEPVALPTPRGREDHKAEAAEQPPRPQHGPQHGPRERRRHQSFDAGGGHGHQRPRPSAATATATATASATATPASSEGALEAADDATINQTSMG